LTAQHHRNDERHGHKHCYAHHFRQSRSIANGIGNSITGTYYLGHIVNSGTKEKTSFMRVEPLEFGQDWIDNHGKNAE
jgi:hypothetical protein